MQVKVAQAVYVKASRMNHACDPNVHVSFQSRCLSARTIKSVLAGAPLEISYGPQVSLILIFCAIEKG
jgi:SET domain-containing protein